MTKTEPCLCAAGLPIGLGRCVYCKADENDRCGMLDHITPAEIKENIAAAKRGDKPVNF